MEKIPEFCQITCCFRPAVKKRGIIWVCEVHLHHTKFCTCKECRKSPGGSRWTGSVFVKIQE